MSLIPIGPPLPRFHDMDCKIHVNLLRRRVLPLLDDFQIFHSSGEAFRSKEAFANQSGLELAILRIDSRKDWRSVGNSLV